eukprot:gene9964-13401_t
MEFERAIYRVYERCLEGLQDDSNDNNNPNINSKSCRILEFSTFILASFFLLTLIILHVNFVANPGCLKSIILASQNQSGTYGNRNISLLKPDQILLVNLDRTYLIPSTNNKNSLGLRGSSNSDITTQKIAITPYKYTTKKYQQYIAKSNRDFFFYNNNKNDITTTNLALITSNASTSSGETVPSPVLSYDYKFTFNVGLLVLPDKIVEDHKIDVVNVTLSGNQCYGPSSIHTFISISGIDTIIINYLMYTFKTSGYVFTSKGSYFSWKESDLYPYHNIVEWLTYKFGMLLKGVCSFFFLSTITALLVRVLISSGVVLLFPIFWLLQLFGMGAINLRIISLSYPWIGIPMEMIRARNQSLLPFIIAHITRVVVYYVFYQACQMSFAAWFYKQDSDGQQELWLFAIMMLWEYFSMIYVRSIGSILLFPRASLGLFLIYHFYYYSFPAGYHMLALFVMFLFLLLLMFYCIRVFEVKAFHYGHVSIDQPRMLYNTLPWPTWRVELAPEFTLFLPLTNRSFNVYQHAVPNLHPPQNDSNNNNNGNNVVADENTPIIGNSNINGDDPNSAISSAQLPSSLLLPPSPVITRQNRTNRNNANNNDSSRRINNSSNNNRVSMRDNDAAFIRNNRSSLNNNNISTEMMVLSNNSINEGKNSGYEKEEEPNNNTKNNQREVIMNPIRNLNIVDSKQPSSTARTSASYKGLSNTDDDSYSDDQIEEHDTLV